MPSPPLTPTPPTHGPSSNLISTSTDEGPPYEVAYNTHRTGGPGNVILTEEERRLRMGTFSGGAAAVAAVQQGGGGGGGQDGDGGSGSGSARGKKGTVGDPLFSLSLSRSSAFNPNPNFHIHIDIQDYEGIDEEGEGIGTPGGNSRVWWKLWAGGDASSRGVVGAGGDGASGGGEGMIFGK